MQDAQHNAASVETKDAVRACHDLLLSRCAARTFVEPLQSHGAKPIDSRDRGNVFLKRATDMLAFADAAREVW